jgi:predicted transcriptional regulator YdeE
MRSSSVILASVLVASLCVLAAAQDQTSKAPTVVQGLNAADADPKPCNRQGTGAPDAVRDSANQQISDARDKRLPSSPAMRAGIRAIPVNPPTIVLPPDKPEPISLQDIAWEDLVDTIGLYNYYAERTEKAGEPAKAELWRTSYQRRARLNDAEGEVLQDIAHDCHCALKEQDAKIAVELEKFRAQIAPGATVTIPADYYQMFKDRKMIIRDHVEQLREGLGDAAFKRVEAAAFSLFPQLSNKNAARPRPQSPTTATRENANR